MSMPTQAAALHKALRAIIPAADISILHERPWHSLTFCGTQLCLSVHMQDGTWHSDAEALSQLLSEHEFDLPRQIVADIAVTQAVATDGGHCLIIDALLLGSGLIDHNQKMTVAAMQMADMKVCAHRS
jgi:hypothetical protein